MALRLASLRFAGRALPPFDAPSFDSATAAGHGAPDAESLVALPTFRKGRRQD